ncbi:MAG: hypothetical protein KAH25_09860, partial [Bacteroidales bacterium]|nr:hypothetical protein [Bacteroidales bacterium]
MKKIYIIALAIASFSLSTFAQVADDLLPNGAIKYSTRDNWNIAVFPVDFNDIPSEYRNKFPSKTDWNRILFQEDISVWYNDMSYGVTTITGDVFDYTTSS